MYKVQYLCYIYIFYLQMTLAFYCPIHILLSNINTVFKFLSDWFKQNLTHILTLKSCCSFKLEHIYQLGWIIQRICVASCLNDECKQAISVGNIQSQTVVAADSGLPYVVQLLSFYCLLLCATLTWNKFSQLWTDTEVINTIRAALRVIGSRTTVKVNYEYTC